MSHERAGEGPARTPRAVIFGCAGERLSETEAQFFKSTNPVGFILFKRNCRAPAQVLDLVNSLRAAVGRADTPVLIDQEGGRVARLGPPHWRRYPPAAHIAALPDPLAQETARLGARLIADDLARLGITVDCLPVLDLAFAGADAVIGNRSYGGDPHRAARLGAAVCSGLLEGGVLPVIKHIPGHGRARVDSHRTLPVVDARREDLSLTDFVPFRALAHMPWAMTAHIVYSAIDPHMPATLSPRAINEVVRGEIGFDGVLVTDDLSMGALGGGMETRTRRALAAGCDLILHCNGDPSEMDEIAAAALPISAQTAARLRRGESLRMVSGKPFDRAAAEARFDAAIEGRE